MRIVTLICFMAATFTLSARGQGFSNLDFESAYNLPGNPPTPDGVDVPAANGLPAWTAFNNVTALADINYVSNFFGGSSTTVELEGGKLALSGIFSVGLYGSDASISQAGSVPGNAESLQFEATINAQPNLQVTLGGQSLSYSVLSTGPNYDVYGADIPSEMDGQTETLTFGIEGPSYSLLDNIEFLPTSVPEPSVWALIGIGVVLFGASHLRLALAQQAGAA